MPRYFIPVLSKTFDRPKLDEDMEIGIRGIYQDNGYFKVLVKDPIIQNVTVNEGYLPKKVPLLGVHHGAGHQHHDSDRGRRPVPHGHAACAQREPRRGPVLQDRPIWNPFFPIKKGEIFSVAKVRKAIEDYTKLYGNFGFIDFTAVPDTEVHDDTKTIDLTFAFDQQKQFFVRRIDFSGNTGTRDKVIRRELLLNEGDMFRNNLWELSLLRLNQLDYFEAVKPENAEIKRNVKQGTVDILLKLKEKGKQSISLTGGVSGFAGTYIGLTYQTNNFLGLGETLTLSGNIGTIQRSANFGFTEPYLFDRPISTGFTVFTSRYNFDQARQYSLALGYQVQLNPNTVQNYIQNSDGFTLFASYPLKKLGFTRLGLTYGFTATSITGLSTASTALFDVLQFQQLQGPSALSGIHESKITPTLSYNTVDNPINPTHGKSLFLSSSHRGQHPRRQREYRLANHRGQIFSPELSQAQRNRHAYPGGVRDGIRRQGDPSLQPVLSGRRAGFARVRHPHGFAGGIRAHADVHLGFLYQSTRPGRLRESHDGRHQHSHIELPNFVSGRGYRAGDEFRVPHPAFPAREQFRSLAMRARPVPSSAINCNSTPRITRRSFSNSRSRTSRASSSSSRVRISNPALRRASSWLCSSRSSRRPSGFIGRTTSTACPR